MAQVSLKLETVSGEVIFLSGFGIWVRDWACSSCGLNLGILEMSFNADPAGLVGCTLRSDWAHGVVIYTGEVTTILS